MYHSLNPITPIKNINYTLDWNVKLIKAVPSSSLQELAAPSCVLCHMEGVIDHLGNREAAPEEGQVAGEKHPERLVYPGVSHC